MRLLRRHFLGLAVAAVALAGAAPAYAGTVSAAVAANFTKVATDLAAKFKAKTGNDVTLSFGATGALYTQITQAAPFDVFLSADDKRTKTAIKDGNGVDGTEFTYAVGKVVLYSPTIDVTKGDEVLKANAFQHIAIADPEGRALWRRRHGGARQARADRGRDAEDRHRREHHPGASSSSTAAAPSSASWRSARSSASRRRRSGCAPQEDYPAITQNAVLLKHGADNQAAKDFLDYLKSR